METDYKVKLEVFEGPLDLLLYLIKRDEIDIYDISIERITRQYLEYLQAFKELKIDIAGEFVVMAANLIYLKSRSLLPLDQQPPEEDAEEDDPRWDLIRQLIEYKKLRRRLNNCICVSSNKSAFSLGKEARLPSMCRFDWVRLGFSS